MPNHHERTDKDGNPVRNVLLSAIPEKEFKLLEPHLRHIAFTAGQNLQEPRDAIDASYFINSGLVSVVVGTRSGKSVEVGIAGYEGMTGSLWQRESDEPLVGK
jgi:CRP-like cAMP-binding protein